MDESAIKARIREAREKLHKSQVWMAGELGMERNTYRNIEEGGTQIVNKHLGKIAELLGTSEEELLLGYRPCRTGDRDNLDEAREQYLSKNKEIEKTYEEKLIAEKKINEALKEAILALKDQVKAKDEQILMLKKRKKS